MILFCCASELGLPEDLSAIEVILYYYYYHYSIYCIHVFFSFPNYRRCHTYMFLIKHPIYNDWSIGMRVYVNCVCRLSRIFLWEINLKVLLFLLLLE